ncbi:MAG: hypothetical protein MI785_18185 [Kiloniellales bacterium]|nr:hypothetical protein [Kiloniellales bacterium]
MTPYTKPNLVTEVPSDAEIQRLLQRGRRLRAEAVAASAEGLVQALRSLIATGKDHSRKTAEATAEALASKPLASKPQGSPT